MLALFTGFLGNATLLSPPLVVILPEEVLNDVVVFDLFKFSSCTILPAVVSERRPSNFFEFWVHFGFTIKFEFCDVVSKDASLAVRDLDPNSQESFLYLE